MELTRDLVKNLELTRDKKDGTREKIRLSEIADFCGYGIAEIREPYRPDQIPCGVSAIADGYNVGLVADEVERALADYQVPDGYTLVMSGENETINDAMEQIYLMMLLAVVFMYLIMVAQFQSLLFALYHYVYNPPGVYGGDSWDFIFSGSEVSVIALIGFVMLSGIIVNNGIVLVDYINQLRESGMEKERRS